MQKMTDWDKLQSKVIDLLRFPMAVAVVVLHYGTTLINGATGITRVLCIVIEEGLCRLAVPCFFFISGLLFFHGLQNWNWNRWQEKLKRRVRTLLIPYVLWNILAFFAFWCYELLQGEGMAVDEYFYNVGGLKILWNIDGGLPISIRGPLDGPLWFIRDLMYYVLAAPLIYYFIVKTKGIGVLFLVLIFLCVQGVIPEGFIFFICGAALKINERNIIKLCWRRRHILYVFSSLLLIAIFCLFDFQIWGRLVKNIFLFVGIAAVFCLVASTTDRWKVNPFLVRSSFFIFATHKILILQQIAIPLVNKLSFSGPAWECICFFLTPTLAVCICLGLLYLMEQLLPYTTRLLIGR